MHVSTKKWILTKLSSLVLIPFMIWFIINLSKIYDNDYQSVISFLNSHPSKFLVSIFLIFAYFFSALSISEVFEDYISDENIKNAANKGLNLFAIVFPLFTIIILFNLN